MLDINTEVLHSITLYKNWMKHFDLVYPDSKDNTKLEILESETNKLIIRQFLWSSISKKDLSILNAMMPFFNQKEQSFFFKYDDLIDNKMLNLSKPNLSRTLKSLTKNLFIIEITNTKNIKQRFKLSRKARVYFFRLSYEVLKKQTENHLSHHNVMIQKHK
jgi:hypothetical protein